MSERPGITRRTALSRLLACSGVGALWTLGNSPSSSARPRAIDAWDIEAGSHVGDITLGASERFVTRLLGTAEKRSELKGFDLETLRSAGLRVGMPEDQLPTNAIEPSVALSYYSLGLQISLEYDGVKHIIVYSGVRAGYEPREFSRFEGELKDRSLTLLSNMYDVLRTLGPPSRRGKNEFADIPVTWMGYDSGLNFDFCSESCKLSHLMVCRPKRP